MQLSQYLEKHNITHDEFAAQIGKHRTSVSRFCSGDRKPDLETLQAIHEATKGKVKPEDFFRESAA